MILADEGDRNKGTQSVTSRKRTRISISNEHGSNETNPMNTESSYRSKLHIDILSSKLEPLAKKYGDGKHIHKGITLKPNGAPVESSLQHAKAILKTENSPYKFTRREKIHEDLILANKARAERHRSPEVMAQRHIQGIVSEMIERAEPLPNDFNQECSSNVNNNNNPKIELAPVSNNNNSNNKERLKARVLPSQLRQKLASTFDQPMFDLIHEWREEISSLNIKPVVDKAPNTYLEQVKARGVNIYAGEAERPIPSIRDAVMKVGNAPAFSGIIRHPPPCRLPSQFSERGKNSGEQLFVDEPKTEWRSTPEEVVLERAYSYMLGNIAIHERDSTQVSEEMKTNLDNLMNSNIGRGYWKDQVTSMLAQPLDASAYCTDREAQVFSAASAPGLEESIILPTPATREVEPGKYQRVDPLKSVTLGKETVPVPLCHPKEEHHFKEIPNSSVEKWSFRFSDEAHQAATVIQRVYKTRFRKRSKSCTKIQKRARGMIYRIRVSKIRAEKVFSATKIQAHMRGYMCRVVLIFLKMALSYNVTLHELRSWEIAEMPCNIKIAIAKRKMEDARKRFNGRQIRLFTILQAHHRGYLGRVRAAQRREELRRQTIVAIHMQRLYRGAKSRARTNPIRKLVKRGFSLFQGVIRGVIQRKKYRSILKTRMLASIKIERVFRGYLGRHVRDKLLLERRAATKINSIVRGKLVRSMIKVWKPTRVKAEIARLAQERGFVKDCVDKSKEKVKKFLKTKEGHARMKLEIELASERRKKLKAARLKMTTDELNRSLAVEAFEMFDMDGSGEISEDEFKQALKELCIPLNAEQRKQAFLDMDLDKSGEIELEEFVLWYNKYNFEKSNEPEVSIDIKKGVSKLNKVFAFILAFLMRVKQIDIKKALQGFVKEVSSMTISRARNSLKSGLDHLRKVFLERMYLFLKLLKTSTSAAAKNGQDKFRVFSTKYFPKRVSNSKYSNEKKRNIYASIAIEPEQLYPKELPILLPIPDVVCSPKMTRRIEVIDEDNPETKIKLIEDRQYHVKNEKSLIEEAITKIIKLELKATKAFRDFTGLTDRAMAKRAVYAEICGEAREKAILEFRRKQPHDRWYHDYYLPRIKKMQYSRWSVLPT